MEKQLSKELLQFIQHSPSPFHAIDTISKELDKQGFICLHEEEKWNLEKGKNYYVDRNGSSIIAFKIGKEIKDYSFNLVASHSDSPVFKVKEHAEIEFRNKYASLNTEGYGGMIHSSWLDRPLSIAGRALVKVDDRLEIRLVNIDRDLMIIPNVAIHMNRNVNDGFSYNLQVDMLPILAGNTFTKGDYYQMIAKELKVDKEALLGLDMFVYNRSLPTLLGMNEEFIASPKLDDLQCAFASLKGFIEGYHDESIGVYCCFDNEEVGSSTRQGAAGTFLYDTLTRINSNLGYSQEDYLRALASSLMLSCDNAHAIHPAHPEKVDPVNHVYMNEGVVVKAHASQRYTTDGITSGLMKTMAKKANVPLQFFHNRSDVASGGTLGNISGTKVSVMAVDLGLPQLAMHSSYEMAGIKDTYFMKELIKTCFNTHIQLKGKEIYTK